MPCEWRYLVNTGAQVVVTGNVHKVAELLHAQLVLRQPETRRACLLACDLEWNVPEQWHPTPALLPGKSHGRRSLVGCSP